MIYNLLADYRKHLEETYSVETARVYTTRLAWLFSSQNIADIDCIDISKVIAELSKIKYKNHFSQSKNALLKFCQFQNIALSYDNLVMIDKLGNCTRKKYRKLKVVDFNKVMRTINRLKNEKLKICFQTLIETGLRVSELAQIFPENCTVTDDDITFSFIGKGGKIEQAVLYKKRNAKLYNRLKSRIEKTPCDRKIFYSAVYLQKKAKHYGFTCHDLRRAFAKIEYKKSKSKAHVKEKLRHTSIKTTNIYLRSKVRV